MFSLYVFSLCFLYGISEIFLNSTSFSDCVMARGGNAGHNAGNIARNNVGNGGNVV